MHRCIDKFRLAKRDKRVKSRAESGGFAGALRRARASVQAGEGVGTWTARLTPAPIYLNLLNQDPKKGRVKLAQQTKHPNLGITEPLDSFVIKRAIFPAWTLCHSTTPNGLTVLR